MTTPDIAADLAAAAQLLADRSAGWECLAATEGPEAVARAAWFPGHLLGTAGGIEQKYRQLAAGARKRAA